MSNIFLAFITGLTTGGLSCLAVQGGLLASSLTQQLEKDFLPASGRHGRTSQRPRRPQTALPILAFLGAKIAAYTILGFLLGWIGSALQLTPTARAVMLIAIGIFMLGNALHLLNVHPIFRYFVIEPPKFVTRRIRRLSKNGDTLVTPLLLGAMTVLIPCGITQAMMATAIGSGNPWEGAALLLAFTLGTSPVFFLVSYLATQVGASMEKVFLRVVAVVVLILGLVSVNSGLTLVGSPLAMANLFQQSPPAAITLSADNQLTLNVQNQGYSPNVLFAKAGTPIVLTLVTQNTSSCARSFVIPALRIEKLLPATGNAQVEIPAQKAGTTIYYSCSMGMYSGQIKVV